jgi:hypothetical protein
MNLSKEDLTLIISLLSLLLYLGLGLVGIGLIAAFLLGASARNWSG